MLRILSQLLKSAVKWALNNLNDYEDDVTFTQRALKEYREQISHKIQP
jgi:GR25 family glycosyltransferase involved in LPS biosynthesis